MKQSEDTDHSENDDIEIDNIKLSEEMKNTCDLSPMELCLYYITYPSLLLKDAYNYRISPFKLLEKTWIFAIEYWNKKYNQIYG